MNKILLRRVWFALSVFVFCFSVIQPPAAALSDDQYKVLRKGILYFNTEEDDDTCSTSTDSITTPATGDQSSNLDYSGKPIFNPEQLAAIQRNRSAYEQAGQKSGIPWEMIAVIHYRETRLARINPGNGQGVYQFVDKRGGPYPPSGKTEISDAEFLKQTLFAGEFIKQKAGGPIDASDTAKVKDTFFSYNGRSSKYVEQAVRLGFPKEQGYEGSPYVMNKADAQRDPAVNTTTWGQVKKDFGPIEYPANKDYGAYVLYASLAGVSLSSTCTPGGGGENAAVTGPVRSKVVQLAQQELELWNNGQLKPGGYTKYSGGVRDNWCAFFASWIYNQAGYPIDQKAADGRVGPVSGIMAIGKAGGRFTWHDAAGYTPQPGDMAIFKSAGQSHVNIVVAVSGNTITVIGGNQGNGGFNSTKVTQYPYVGVVKGLTGYVSPASTEDPGSKV